MTDQEKKRQYANLVVEIQSARENFAHLRERLFSLADGFDEVARVLRRNGDLKPSRADFDSEFEDKNRLKPESRVIFDFESTVAAIEELRTARKQLFSLAERNAQLSSASASIVVPLD